MTKAQTVGYKRPFPPLAIKPDAMPEWCQVLLSGYVSSLATSIQTYNSKCWYAGKLPKPLMHQIA